MKNTVWRVTDAVHMPLSEIEHEITRTGNALMDGNLGANPAYIDNVLKKKGYDVEMNYFPKTTEIEEEIKNGDTCILLFGYINDDGSPGAHYVTINYDENSDKPFGVYNNSNNSVEVKKTADLEQYTTGNNFSLAIYKIRGKHNE